MVLVIKKGATKSEIEKIEKQLQSTEKMGFDAAKYNGIIHFNEDALLIQKQLRNEWERTFS
jgi:hypothetical protein